MHRASVTRGMSTASGTVIIDASVNAKGEVTDARVVSGPDELRKPALQSVLQWHYSTISALPPAIRVTIKYDPLPVSSSPVRVVPAAPMPPPGAVIKQIRILGASPETERDVRQRLTIHDGDPATTESYRKILETAREIDEHFTGGFSAITRDGRDEITVTLMLGPGNMAAPAVLPAPVPSSTTNDGNPATPQRVRVGGNVQQANLIRKVTPAYPPDAKQARIQGIVKLNATINRDGTIQALDVISGHPMLVDAAVEAVKQWQYKPTLLNGNPVEVLTQIDVNFTLMQ